MLSKYDEWRLRGPEERHETGVEDGQPCERFPEPDEDMGRARPRRCTGTMVADEDGVCCDTCGATAEDL